MDAQLILGQGLFGLLGVTFAAAWTLAFGIRSVRRGRAADVLTLAPPWAVLLALALQAWVFAGAALRAEPSAALTQMGVRNLATILLYLRLGVTLTAVALGFGCGAQSRGRRARGIAAGAALAGALLLSLFTVPVLRFLLSRQGA